MAASGGGSSIPTLERHYNFLKDAISNPDYIESFGLLRKHQSRDKSCLSAEDSLIVTIFSEVVEGASSPLFRHDPVLAFHNSVDDYVPPKSKATFLSTFEGRLYDVFEMGHALKKVISTFKPKSQQFVAMLVHQISKDYFSILDEFEAPSYKENNSLFGSVLPKDTPLSHEVINAAFHIGKAYEDEYFDDLIEFLKSDDNPKPESTLLEDLTTTVETAFFIGKAHTLCKQIATSDQSSFFRLYEEITCRKENSIDRLYAFILKTGETSLRELELCDRFYSMKRIQKNAIRRRLLAALPPNTRIENALKRSSYDAIERAFFDQFYMGKKGIASNHVLNRYSSDELLTSLYLEPGKNEFIYSCTTGALTLFPKVTAFDLHYSLELENGVCNSVTAAAFHFLCLDVARKSTKKPCLLLDDLVRNGASAIRAQEPAPPDPKRYYRYYLLRLSEILSSGALYDTFVFPRFTGKATKEGFLPLVKNHAALMYVDLPSLTLTYFDSVGDLQGDGEIASRAFIDAFKALKDNPRVHEALRLQATQEDWKILTPTASCMFGVPKQTTSKHCAVFSFMYAHDLLRSKSFDFFEHSLDERRKELVLYVYKNLTEGS